MPRRSSAAARSAVSRATHAPQSHHPVPVHQHTDLAFGKLSCRRGLGRCGIDADAAADKERRQATAEHAKRSKAELGHGPKTRCLSAVGSSLRDWTTSGKRSSADRKESPSGASKPLDIAR